MDLLATGTINAHQASITEAAEHSDDGSVAGSIDIQLSEEGGEVLNRDKEEFIQINESREE